MVRSNDGCWPKPLLAMIGASHSREAMQQFRDYVPDDRAWDIFKEMSQSMLTAVRPAGSSCVIMSALLATVLEEPLGTVVPVVAGALKLDGDYMYGTAIAGSCSANTSSTSRSAALPARGIAARRWRSESFPNSGRMPE